MKKAIISSLILMLISSQQISAEEKKSLRSTCANKFSVKKILKVNSTVDQEASYIHLYSPSTSQAETFKCAKQSA